CESLEKQTSPPSHSGWGGSRCVCDFSCLTFQQREGVRCAKKGEGQDADTESTGPKPDHRATCRANRRQREDDSVLREHRPLAMPAARREWLPPLRDIRCESLVPAPTYSLAWCAPFGREAAPNRGVRCTMRGCPARGARTRRETIAGHRPGD